MEDATGQRYWYKCPPCYRERMRIEWRSNKKNNWKILILSLEKWIFVFHIVFQNYVNIGKGQSEEDFMAQRYLTDKQLAERFNVSRQWVWTQSKQNAEFPQPIKLSQGCTRFSILDVERFELERVKKSQQASRHGRLKTVAWQAKCVTMGRDQSAKAVLKVEAWS